MNRGREAEAGILAGGAIPYRVGMIDPAGLCARFALLLPHLDERGRRLFAATEARAAGYGGIAAVSRATGIAVSTIGRGVKELATAARLDADRVRRPGGGRKPLVATDTALLDDLLALVAPSERGDPMSPLRWTCKSLRRLAGELAARGHRISHTVVGELLKQQKFSLQATCKPPASHLQDQGGQPPPGSRCAVRLHQPERFRGAGRAAAGDLGGHKEDGTGRRLQERRPGVAPPRPAGGRSGA